MKKPILCLDFDGVIHSYTSGWKGADVVPDPIVNGAIAFMLGALHHFDVVIFSSRSNQPGGINAMRRWLREQAGACWHESPDGPGIEDVRFVTEKPPAMVGIDDRVLTFTGRWPDPRTLLDFKPWNKTSIRSYVESQPAAGELTEGLMPCPFCGQTEATMSVDNKDGWFYWCCDECEACGPWERTASGATAAWNRRA